MGIDALDSVLALKPESTPLYVQPTPPTTPREDKKKVKAERCTSNKKITKELLKHENDNLFNMLGLQTVDDLLLGHFNDHDSVDQSGSDVDEINEVVSVASETEIQTEIGDISDRKNNEPILKYVL